MSALRPVVDERAREALDALDVPVSVATAVRDRDGRLLDFRLVLVNRAATTWAGLDRGAILGRLATDLLPGLRETGLFEALDQVVSTGRPFRLSGERYEGNVEAGRSFSGVYEVMAVRHGDGYLSAWAERAGDRPTPGDLEGLLERARAAVPLVRLEASRTVGLRPRPAT